MREFTYIEGSPLVQWCSVEAPKFLWEDWRRQPDECEAKLDLYAFVHDQLTDLKIKTFFPPLTNARHLSSSQRLLVKVPKTWMFNPCWESRSLPTIRGKWCLLDRMLCWTPWGIHMQGYCSRSLRGIISLMWLRLWKGCVLTQHLYRGHQHQQAPSQYVNF